MRRPRAGGAIVFQTGFDSHVYNVAVRDGQVKTSGLGYGISFDESCVFCSVKNSYFENLRENTFTNRTRWCAFEGNVAIVMTSDGWNTHGAGSDYNVCRNNEFRDCSNGVALGWGGGTRADSHNTVENNFMYRSENGVSVAGNSTGPIIGLGNTVKNNTIENPGVAGIQMSYQSPLTVSGNTVRDSTSASCRGIYASVTVSNSQIMQNDVSSLTGAGATGIQIASSSDIDIIGNNVRDLTASSGTAFYVPSGSSGIHVHLNNYQNVTGGVSLTGAFDTMNTWN